MVLGIRPEHVRLPEEGDTQTVRGDVFLVENLGMSDLVSMRVHGDENLVIRSLLPTDATWEQASRWARSAARLPHAGSGLPGEMGLSRCQRAWGGIGLSSSLPRQSR